MEIGSRSLAGIALHSEFKPCLEGNHTRRAVAAQPNSKQSSWRRHGIRERAESGLCGGPSWNARVAQDGQAEIGVIKYVEELGVDPQLQSVGQPKPFGYIKIAPREISSAKRIPSEVSKSATPGSISTNTRSCAWVHSRNECIRIQPLNRARLRNAGNRIMFIRRRASDQARELGTTAIDDAVSVRGVSRA